MLERLERDIGAKDSDEEEGSHSSKPLSVRVKPTDILVKETITRVTVENMIVEVRETLKFRPPRAVVSSHALKMNTVNPNDLGHHENRIDEEFKEGDDAAESVEEGSRRNKRRAKIQAFERTQQFFADQKPNTRKRLRGSKDSPNKKSATMLRQSIE